MLRVILRPLILLRLPCFWGLCIVPSLLYAQAGSGPALLFDSPDSRFQSEAGESGANEILPSMPEGALLLPDSMHFLLWVELGAGQLNVLERIAPDHLVLRKRIPVSIGKQGIGKILEGDQKTPVGVYRLTSFLTDAQLDDFYGLGAFPISYPNAMDNMLGHTGHGIWLHGLPKDVAQRPLLDSDGCIVVDNDSLLGLKDNIREGQTYIIMSPQTMRWIPSQSQQQTRKELQTALNAWKQAWEAKDNERYLEFYAEDFSDLRRNKAEWSSYKTRVNNSKSRIALNLSDVSMMVDPVQQDQVTVRYYQNYISNNYTWSGWKEQIWRNSALGWRILYEGNG